MLRPAAQHLFRRFRGLLPVAALALLPACGSDSSSPTGVAGPVTVSGQFTKGPVSAASVSVHAIDAGGAPGAVLGGPFTTDANGAWSGELPAGTTGPFLLSATGGSYTDEASGATVDVGAARLLGYTANGSGQVTPFTHALAAAANAQINAGRATPDAAWGSVIGSFQTAFGFDPTTTVPGLTGSTEARTYLALLGGLSALLDGNPALTGLSGATLIDLVLAFAADLADGVLDGTDAGGNPITVETGGGAGTWPPLDGTGIAAFVAAVNAYAAGTAGLGDIVLGPVDLDFGGSSSGDGSGSVMLSGPGAALVGNATFVPFTFSSNGGALAWAATSQGVSVQIGVTRSPADPTRAILVSVTAQGRANAYGWWDFAITPGTVVTGVTISGNDVTFANVVAPGQTGTELPITLNGTLGE